MELWHNSRPTKSHWINKIKLGHPYLCLLIGYLFLPLIPRLLLHTNNFPEVRSVMKMKLVGPGSLAAKILWMKSRWE